MGRWMLYQPTFKEIGKAIHLVTSGKAHGADSIFAEVYKEAGTGLTEKLHQLFWETTRPVTSVVKAPCCPSQARLRPEFYSTASLHISLLSIAGKAQARVLLNPLTVYLQRGLLPERLCSFRKGRGTIDMMFT